MRAATGILQRFLRALVPRATRAAVAPTRPPGRAATPAGHSNSVTTVEVVPPGREQLRLSYSPRIDGDPDAGEIVWTWVPYDENDGRGKDRPVLVIARAPGERVYAVRLTSQERNGDRDYLPLGSGPWDSRRRPSWVDIEQLYIVHPQGMRREAATLDAKRFGMIARALQKRYGWAIEA